jgi:hypothetical protein
MASALLPQYAEFSFLCSADPYFEWSVMLLFPIPEIELGNSGDQGSRIVPIRTTHFNPGTGVTLQE